jgi:hypothetical protein
LIFQVLALDFLADKLIDRATGIHGNRNFPGYSGGSDFHDISSSAPRPHRLQSRSLQRIIRAQLKHHYHQIQG